MTFLSFELRAVACAVLGLAASLAQAQADTANLETVTVTGVRADGLKPQTVEAGSFRGADIMDVPSTVNVVTREALDLQGAAGLYDAVRNTADVTKQQNGGETWDQLVIRGISVDNRSNYRLNGSLAVMNFAQVPMEDKERVEVLKGASALYYGFTTPAGVVNFVTKRAGLTPVTTLGLTLDQYGSAVASADIGRRFGDRQQYGVRVNAAGGTLGSYLDSVGNGNRTFLSTALDWRVNERLTLKADFEYERRKVTEQVGVQLPTAVNGVITLPHAVNPKNLVGPSLSTFFTETTNAQVRADYALSDDWSLTLEAGRARTERDRNLPIFRFSNAASVATGAGNIQGNSQHLDITSDLLRAELFGNVRTGFISHEITLGATRTDTAQDPIYQTRYTVASQNLYNPVPITSVTWGATPTTPTTAALDTRDTGLYLVDRLKLSEQWQVIGGVRRSSYRSDQGPDHYDVSETTPMAAVIYRPLQSLSVYASYAKGLEPGETAPTGTDNVGQRLKPGVSQQKELGLRWQAPGGTLWSVAVFDIDQPGYYTNTDNIYVADGAKRYTGIELSAQGQLTRQLGWQASTQWLDPRFQHIDDNYNGKLPENAARRTASAFLTYAVAAVPGLSVNGGAYYTGRRPVNDLNQAWLGGVTLYALGSRYETKLYGRRNTWQVNVENVADKRYWAGAGTRLAAGAPRTIKLTYKIDL
ncbi:MAG: Ferrichrome receptor FcuA [Paracidovorax wautersii]|uniref:Ferrichrome receptor FcuA n=1 Tax=Paracidovorax wautersii TaxID=1177982 RepID=A0A7V8FN73_9BURK|nr:MAG: Ferrichrome receptor FcuA [Paracidovorax wautersii]